MVPETACTSLGMRTPRYAAWPLRKLARLNSGEQNSARTLASTVSARRARTVWLTQNSTRARAEAQVFTGHAQTGSVIKE